MTAEWLHLPPPYPPGVGPLCGAELEAWYEDLQDILGSDTGGAKLARAPTCIEKEPEFLDVLESCSLTWLTDGNQTWSEGAQRATEEIHSAQSLHHTSSSSSSSSCMSPAVTEEQRAEAESGRSRDGSAGGGSDLLPPEFFELLSEGGVGMVDSSGTVLSGGYYYHNHQSHPANDTHPVSPSASEEELPCVPDSPSYSSSASLSPSQNCSSPSSPVSSPSVYPSSLLGKRKRITSEKVNSALSSFASSTQRATSSYSSAKKSRKEREQENERKVQELTEQNERLKAEIERLGEEVQRTRRALIERLVNSRK
ncbi:DNA damage-inducible transcript 3 protein [Antennarius striatus]|uniref:DNA damage-inducible transcript 3 protein n=1 Tax=Antennarius striatus TaxID=241820 RepID=UPI0035AE4D26